MNLPFLQSAPGDAVVVVEGSFDTTVERMYRAWTDAEELMKWFGPSKGALIGVEVDLKVGGRVCFEFQPNQNRRAAIEGVYLDIEPCRKLVFTWSHVVVSQNGEKKVTPESRVTVTFQSVGEQTRVRLRHDGIATQDGRDGVSYGWNGSLEQLRAYCDANH